MLGLMILDSLLAIGWELAVFRCFTGTSKIWCDNKEEDEKTTLLSSRPKLVSAKPATKLGNSAVRLRRARDNV